MPFLGSFSSPFWKPVLHHTSPRASTATFLVALKLENSDDMKKTLLDVSNPTSVNYGKYLSLEEISTNYGPSLEEQNIVMDFFRSIQDARVELNANKDLILVTAHVQNIEKSLETEISWFSHVSNDNFLSLRALRPIKLPANVANVVSFLSLNSPILHPNFVESRIHRRKTSRSQSVGLLMKTLLSFYKPDSNLFKGISPTVLNTITDLYGIPKGNAVRNPLSSQAVAEFYGEVRC